MNRHNNLILCGFMGTGKSAVGKLASKKLRYRFVDTDELIERRCGKSVAQIFEEEGEEFFRAREGEIARELLTIDNTVVSAGGGMIVNEDNYRLLSRTGLMVLLTASAETICERLAGTEPRPLLGSSNTEKRVRDILSARRRNYERIKYRVDTDGLSIAQVCEEVLRIHREANELKRA